jgi:hypothetical protein
MTSYDGVKSIAVAVGGGGGGGTSGQEADGGRNGQSLTGYSGGNGGKSGVSGISGSGGGGGGATTVTLFESGQSVNNIEVAIAGGGAGSGGSGTYSLGGAGINLNVATGNTPDSLGENGAGKSTLVKVLYGLLETQAGQDQILYQVVAQKIMVQVQHQAEQEFHIMHQA